MSEAAATTPDPFQLCGTTIEGKYRVASVVGDGGFGVVYRGVHKGFGELIAVKCLKIPNELDDKQQEALLEQLRDEGRLLHRLSKATSGIVQALDVGAFTTPGGVWVPYLVLEWLEGETLAEHVSKRFESGEGAFTLADAIRLLEPASRALAIAHGQKVAHRDVKPPNLFVTEVGGTRTLKVLDFGIAKVLTESTARLAATKVGPSAFTPRYGAPEQFNKKRGASGPWTDVFALALILVELVSGKKALDGDDPTELYISSSDPNVRPTPRTRGVAVPDAVEQVLAKALAIDPRDRYADAGTFWDALLEAANVAPTVRTSAPSLPGAAPLSPHAAAQTAVESAREKTEQMTPEQAERAGISLSIGSVPKPAAYQATMPVESLREEPNRLPLVAVRPSESDESPKKSAADPMSETPIHARLPPVPASTAKSELTILGGKSPEQVVLHFGAEGEASGGKKTGASVYRSSPEKSSSTRSWPWVLLLLMGAGAVGGYVVLGYGEPGSDHPFKASFGSGSGRASGSNRAAASPASSASTKAVASSSASAPASAGASAAAGPPPVPPDDMVYVAPTEVHLGEGADARDVTISKGFFFEKFEVTTRAYLQCTAARKCGAADHVSVEASAAAAEADAGAETDSEFAERWSRRCNAPRRAVDHPINCVDFRNAEAYCLWKGRRLPTEAEWELVARGREGRDYAWGAETPECSRACFDKNGACTTQGGDIATCATGLHAADRTPEGVYDLGGNVAEWVQDGFESPPPHGTDPVGNPKAAQHVVRGGSFLDAAEKLHAAARTSMNPGAAHVSVGFRCAADATPADTSAPRP